MRWKRFKKEFMDCTIEDYLKSVYINKTTLTGYISAAAFVGCCYTLHATPGNPNEMLLFYMAKGMTGITAFLSLMPTIFGISTMMAYKRTKKHLQRFGSLEKEFNKYDRYYCTEVGRDYAIKESGLKRVYV